MYCANAREKYLFFNNLVCLVNGLCGKYTTVDLRNESFVTGKIDQVDGYMNIVMTDTVFTDGRGQEHPFEMFFIQARNIRYVHIPDEVRIVPTIKEQVQKMRQPARKKPIPRTYKMKRLMEQQSETLKLIQKN
ncbi:U7 snRNA-associated Sm-like protein LSm10 [Anabrus simplex]|uniref:U7 snRNA-associated Sm-like protein LSm10 n=1 Tax=Anabrus simplex TaxID=316456 RepID=UPI0035A3B8B7